MRGTHANNSGYCKSNQVIERKRISQQQQSEKEVQISTSQISRRITLFLFLKCSHEVIKKILLVQSFPALYQINCSPLHHCKNIYMLRSTEKTRT